MRLLLLAVMALAIAALITKGQETFVKLPNVSVALLLIPLLFTLAMPSTWVNRLPVLVLLVGRQPHLGLFDALRAPALQLPAGPTDFRLHRPGQAVSVGIALPFSWHSHLGSKAVGWPGDDTPVRHPGLGCFSAFQGTYSALVPGRGVGVCFPDTGSDLYTAGDQRHPGCHWLEAPAVDGAAFDPAGWFLRPAGALYLDVCARHVGRDALPGGYARRRAKSNQTNSG